MLHAVHAQPRPGNSFPLCAHSNGDALTFLVADSRDDFDAFQAMLAERPGRDELGSLGGISSPQGARAQPITKIRAQRGGFNLVDTGGAYQAARGTFENRESMLSVASEGLRAAAEKLQGVLQ